MRFLKLTLASSLLLNLLFVSLWVMRAPAKRTPEATRGQAGDYLVEQHGNISIMRHREAPDTDIIVTYEKGRFYWSIETNRLTLNVGRDFSLHGRVDSAQQRFTNLVYAYRDVDGGTVYLRDYDGDGIADERTRRDETEIFIAGEFKQAKATVDGKRIVKQENEEVEFIYVAGRWQQSNLTRQP